MPTGFCYPKTAKQLKRSITMRQLVTFLYYVPNSQGMVCCPFHQDSTPSLWVNDEFAWCFACGRGWDVFDLVREFYSLDFEDAAGWLRVHEAKITDIQVGGGSRKKGEYRGPVDPYIIQQWHSLLIEDHYDYFLKQRGLTRETVDLYQLGWRPDYKAYVIPFWSGVPSQSEVVTVQFRRTDESPPFFTSKFIGLGGHNKPAFIGSHTLQNKDWAVILFGSFDALLAGQDGLPAVSPNGASAFSSKRHESELHKTFLYKHHVYVVSDATLSEWDSVRKTADLLSCNNSVHKFPDGFKDYSDYRLGGHSVSQFLNEVLEIEFK